MAQKVVVEGWKDKNGYVWKSQEEAEASDRQDEMNKFVMNIDSNPDFIPVSFECESESESTEQIIFPVGSKLPEQVSEVKIVRLTSDDSLVSSSYYRRKTASNEDELRSLATQDFLENLTALATRYKLSLDIRRLDTLIKEKTTSGKSPIPEYENVLIIARKKDGNVKKAVS
jgi:hypothetical protein